MERYALAILVICATQSSLADKQYRKDYEYNKKTDAFYKLHIEREKQNLAQEICEAEGASLFVASQDDIRQIHSMTKKFPDLGPVLLASDGQEREPLEEEGEPMIVLDEELPPWTPSKCAALSWKGEVVGIPCGKPAPFVCKVDAQHAHYDKQCDVYGKGYISRVSTTGSCYRISNFAATWNEAYAQCDGEGAHLAVLNSESEKEEVKGLMQAAADSAHSWSQFYFFVGIRAPKNKDRNAPKVFKTVLHQTLEDAGFAEWDNPSEDYENTDYCGSLYKKSGMYNAVSCTNLYSFICEKERR